MSKAESAETVMKKALDILRGELSKEEYLTYLETITPRVGDATKELKDTTKMLKLETILMESKKFHA